MSTYWVTHFMFTRDGEEWIPLQFVVFCEDDPEKFFDPAELPKSYSRAQMMKAVVHLGLVPVKRLKIDAENQQVWADPNRQVWLARKDDPANDPNKIPVEFDPKSLGT